MPNITSWDCILDGGYLLHVVDSEKVCTYNEIIKRYHSFVNIISKNASIVFDGYLEHNTKDQTHERRNPIQSLRIDISGEMTVDCNKKLFLSNSENKEQFINMLLEIVMIVEQTLNLLKNNNVHVIADDTDVFVLLLSKASKVALYGIYLKQPKAERLHILYSWPNSRGKTKENLTLACNVRLRYNFLFYLE